MLYLLEVYAFVTVSVFGAAGLLIFAFFITQEAMAVAKAGRRIGARLSAFTSDAGFFANSLAISRSGSRGTRR